jgi:hypothetical protein
MFIVSNLLVLLKQPERSILPLVKASGIAFRAERVRHSLLLVDGSFPISGCANTRKTYPCHPVDCYFVTKSPLLPHFGEAVMCKAGMRKHQ